MTTAAQALAHALALVESDAPLVPEDRGEAVYGDEDGLIAWDWDPRFEIILPMWSMEVEDFLAHHPEEKATFDPVLEKLQWMARSEQATDLT